jgi:hypothetical protein
MGAIVALDIGDVDEAIYKMLFKQDFSDWYEGTFIPHLQGDEGCKTKDEIKQDLADMLGHIPC